MTIHTLLAQDAGVRIIEGFGGGDADCYDETHEDASETKVQRVVDELRGEEGRRAPIG